MATYVAGLFEAREAAEEAIGALHNAKFDGSLIGMVTPDGQAQEDTIVGEETVEGAAAGVVIGGVAGGILASAGALVIPGIGPFLSAGILMTTLVGGAAGGVAGGLAGLGIHKERAQEYEHHVYGGRTLVIVEAGDRETDAHRILHEYGALREGETVAI
jgi:hypothetical protein